MTPAVSDQQLRQLIDAQAAARARLNAQAVAMAQQAASGFTRWYDGDAITGWATGLAGRIEVLQRQVARITDAYHARTLSLLTGRTIRPIGAVDVSELRSGITHAGSYGRAADAFRYEQHRLDTVAFDVLRGVVRRPLVLDPAQVASRRASVVADVDIALAVRAQTVAVLSAHREVTGYRRVLQPEISRGDVCGLCVGATSQVYRPTELLPIHPRCECATLPVLADSDPGEALNAEDAKDADSAPFTIAEHGEIGPMLVNEGQSIEPHRTSPRRAALPPAQRLRRITALRDRLAEALPPMQELGTGDPVWRAYAQQLETRVAGLTEELAA